ncbi:hypothetical protein HDU92_004883 [Lobulomyces angularis]|nr:hypothetical protein HDU92_004883 [Lobulomyces angularis]
MKRRLSKINSYSPIGLTDVSDKFKKLCVIKDSDSHNSFPERIGINTDPENAYFINHEYDEDSQTDSFILASEEISESDSEADADDEEDDVEELSRKIATVDVVMEDIDQKLTNVKLTKNNNHIFSLKNKKISDNLEKKQDIISPVSQPKPFKIFESLTNHQDESDGSEYIPSETELNPTRKIPVTVLLKREDKVAKFKRLQEVWKKENLLNGGEQFFLVDASKFLIGRKKWLKKGMMSVVVSPDSDGSNFRIFSHYLHGWINISDFFKFNVDNFEVTISTFGRSFIKIADLRTKCMTMNQEFEVSKNNSFIEPKNNNEKIFNKNCNGLPEIKWHDPEIQLKLEERGTSWKLKFPNKEDCQRFKTFLEKHDKNLRLIELEKRKKSFYIPQPVYDQGAYQFCANERRIIQYRISPYSKNENLINELASCGFAYLPALDDMGVVENEEINNSNNFTCVGRCVCQFCGAVFTEWENTNKNNNYNVFDEHQQHEFAKKYRLNFLFGALLFSRYK